MEQTTHNNEVVGRNSETPAGFDFSYLKSWTKEQLHERLGTIMPIIDFMIAMHNAKDKVVRMDLSCVDPAINEIKDYSIHFDTVAASKFGFPQDLEIFIHNFCTFLCAQKMHIELLLTA
jgi:adenosine/AMP kinase